MSKFWNFVKNSDAPDSGRTMYIYGPLEEDSWFDDDVTPNAFREELYADVGPVTIVINSPGGDCIAASQIYTMLIEYPADVTVKIDGMAASAASVVAMAGKMVEMAPTALMMIHDPLTMAWGNKAEMEKTIAILDEVKQSIINAYQIKTGLSRHKISELMSAETWMNAQKALELGFIDRIMRREDAEEGAAALATNSYDFSTRNAQMRVLNMVMEKVHEDEQNEEKTDVDETPVPETNTVDTSEYYKRLNNIEHY